MSEPAEADKAVKFRDVIAHEVELAMDRAVLLHRVGHVGEALDSLWQRTIDERIAAIAAAWWNAVREASE